MCVIELHLGNGSDSFDALGWIEHIVERRAALLPSIQDQLATVAQLHPALHAPTEGQRLDVGHGQRRREVDCLSDAPLLHQSGCPLVESLGDRLLEGALQRHVGDLKLAGAVGGDEHQLDARVMRSQEEAELLALVHRPHVEHEDDGAGVVQTMEGDGSIGVRHQNLDDPLLHRLL